MLKKFTQFLTRWIWNGMLRPCSLPVRESVTMRQYYFCSICGWIKASTGTTRNTIPPDAARDGNWGQIRKKFFNLLGFLSKITNPL